MSEVCGWMYTNWLLSDDYELMTNEVDQQVYEATAEYMLDMHTWIAATVRRDADNFVTTRIQT